MLVGLGGNNGCTCVAGAIANKEGLIWNTKEGPIKANYWGSLMLASTVKLGNDALGNSVYTPLNNMLPTVNPNDIVWGGWDINCKTFSILNFLSWQKWQLTHSQSIFFTCVSTIYFFGQQ